MGATRADVIMQRASDYFTSLAILVALAILYQTAADRWLVPPAMKSVPMAGQVSLRPRESLTDLFPQDAWQRGTCNQIQMRDAVLLFKNLTPGEDNLLTFSPVTVIYGRGLQADSATRPLIMEAEKAELKFARSLDLEAMSSEAPPIESGNLIGNVRIRSERPPTNQGDDRTRSDSSGEDETPIDIRTSYISIDRQKIWTTQPLTMSFGEARLSGRDLTLYLMEAATPQTRDLGSILDRMELIYLDELVIPIGPSGHDESDESSVAATHKGRPDPIGLLRMTCSGGVAYDFALGELALHDSVSFRHQTSGQDDDQFDCNELTLLLRDPLNSDLPRTGPLDWISEVTAVGTAQEPASLWMPGRLFGLVADRIHLDVSGGILEASNVVPPAGSTFIPAVAKKAVTIRYAGIVAGLDKLTYRFDSAEPRRMGRLIAPGQGRIRIEQDRSPVRSLSWSQMLEIKPAATGTPVPHSTPIGDASTFTRPGLAGSNSSEPSPSGQNKQGDWTFEFAEMQVNVDGDVHAALADGGSFAAGHVRCDLKPSTQTPDGEEQTLVPSGFVAKENVRMDTRAVRAQTDDLTLMFQEKGADDVAADPTVVGGEADSPLRHWVMQPRPTDVDQDAAVRATAEPIATKPPTIRGRQIIANLSLIDGSMTADDLSVRGGVQLTHAVRVGEKTLDALLRGDQLRWVNRAGADTISLFSGPYARARLDLGDGYFVGPAIHIRPSANVVEIDEAGEFQMPTEILPTGLGQRPGETVTDDAGGLNWTSAPLCRFGGSMVFDGRAVVLDGGVTIDASLNHEATPWDMQLRGDRLVATLADAVKLRDMKTLRGASIHQLSLSRSGDQPVTVEAKSLDALGRPQTQHVLRAPILTFVPAEGGQLIGEGPGSYWAWAAGKIDAPGDRNGRPSVGGGESGSTPRPRTTVEAAQLFNRTAADDTEIQASPLDADESLPINGLHLTYYDKLVGSLQNQSLTFNRDIHIGVREVSGFGDPVDVMSMQQLADGQMTIRCDRLQLAVDPAGPDAGLPGTRPAGTRPRDASRFPSFTTDGRRTDSLGSTAWEMLADGGVLFRDKRNTRLIEVSASRASYQSAKDNFSLQGTPTRAVIVRRTMPGQRPLESSHTMVNVANLQSEEIKLHLDLQGMKLGELPSGAGSSRPGTR